MQFDDEDCAKASASGKPESYSRPTCSYEYEWVKKAVLWFAEEILQLTAAEDERQVRFLRLCASSHHIGLLIGVVAMLCVVQQVNDIYLLTRPLPLLPPCAGAIAL